MLQQIIRSFLKRLGRFIREILSIRAKRESELLELINEGVPVEMSR